MNPLHTEILAAALARVSGSRNHTAAARVANETARLIALGISAESAGWRPAPPSAPLPPELTPEEIELRRDKLKDRRRRLEESLELHRELRELDLISAANGWIDDREEVAA